MYQQLLSHGSREISIGSFTLPRNSVDISSGQLTTAVPPSQVSTPGSLFQSLQPPHMGTLGELTNSSRSQARGSMKQPGISLLAIPCCIPRLSLLFSSLLFPKFWFLRHKQPFKCLLPWRLLSVHSQLLQTHQAHSLQTSPTAITFNFFTTNFKALNKTIQTTSSDTLQFTLKSYYAQLSQAVCSSLFQRLHSCPFHCFLDRQPLLNAVAILL